MKKIGTYDLEVDFFNFESIKGENIFFSCEENLGIFEIKGTVLKKVGSGQPRAAATKDNYRLKTTVLKENLC